MRLMGDSKEGLDRMLVWMNAIDRIGADARARGLDLSLAINNADAMTRGETAELKDGSVFARRYASERRDTELLAIIERAEQSGETRLLRLQGKAYNAEHDARFADDLHALKRASSDRAFR